jgi:hypothetical protein
MQSGLAQIFALPNWKSRKKSTQIKLHKFSVLSSMLPAFIEALASRAPSICSVISDNDSASFAHALRSTD